MALIWYVHGSGSSQHSFTWLRQQLPCEAKFFTYDVEEPTEDAIDRLHRMISLEPEPVILLGHSLGGIIARAVASHYHVRKLITLCAPFGGLPHAGLASFFSNSHIFRDLRAYSSLLVAIRGHHLDIPHLAVVAEHSLPHLSEANDGVVTVASQISLSNAEYKKFFLNHFEVLLSPTVAKVINDFLIRS